MDISGCYGESLRSLHFPIGLPTVLSHTPNQTPKTLGWFLDKYEDQLVPGLWTAMVSGSLGFEQDYIFSKLVKQTDIRKAVQTQDGDDSDIPSDFVMLRREIKNGIITADVIKTLRAVCTNTEWAEIRNLNIVAVAAYLKRDRVGSAKEWCETVLRDKGSYFISRNGQIQDTRTRAWFAVPLEDFVGEMYEKRKECKRLKSTAETEDERSKAKGLDAILKLTINVVYGAMASRYFRISNTVVANNITARARTGVWMLAKALGLRQTITDGGCYSPMLSHAFDGSYRKAGLDTLSRPWEWHAPNRRRWVRPMPGWDWNAPAWPSQAECDRLASEHTEAFWTPYGLSLPFRLEHKSPFLAAAIWSKGDYAFLYEDSPIDFKLRGKKRNALLLHPSYALLKSILEGRDDFPSDMEHTHTSIMKIGKYRVVQKSSGYEDLKDKRPGDEYTEYRTARYNNTYFPLKDEAEYRRRSNRRRVDHGQTVQFFERFGREGIRSVHRHMASDTLTRGRKAALMNSV